MPLKEKIKETLYKIIQYIKKYFFTVLHPGTPTKAILMWFVNSLIFPIILYIVLRIIVSPFEITFNFSFSSELSSLSAWYLILSLLFLPLYYLAKDLKRQKQETQKKEIEVRQMETARLKEISQKLAQHRELLDNFAKKYARLLPSQTITKEWKKNYLNFHPELKNKKINSIEILNFYLPDYEKINESKAFDGNFINAILLEENQILEEDLTKIFYTINNEPAETLIELLSTKYKIDLTIEETKQIIAIHYTNIKTKELEKIFKSIEKKYSKIIEHYVNYFGETAKQRENFIFFINFLEEKNLLPTTSTDPTNKAKMIALDIQNEIKKQKLNTFERQLEPDTQIFSMQEIDFMTGREFENAMNTIFLGQGYKAITTVYSNDQGADLILEKFGKKIVVQAKRYQGHVPNKAIQEVVAAKQHYKCDEAWIVTNSILTAPAKALAKSNKVKVIEREELKKML